MLEESGDVDSLAKFLYALPREVADEVNSSFFTYFFA